MALQLHVDTRPVEGFAEAIAAQDLESLAWCLHPDVRFRALTPNHTFGHFGSDSAITTIQGWFDDVSILELVSSEVEPVGDRVRVAYRFRVLADGVWSVIEQQAFCTIDEGVVTDVSLVCSGRRPEL
jgi:hypothetical protein